MSDLRPHVLGRRDYLGYTYANWSAAPNRACSERRDFGIPACVPQREETSFIDLRYVEPMGTLFSASRGRASRTSSAWSTAS